MLSHNLCLLSYVSDKIITVSEWGFPLTQMDLRLVVKNYLDISGRTENKFKNNLPGIDWVRSFLMRHKDDLVDRIVENIKRSRAEVCADVINLYFDNLEVSLAGVQPSSLINYDETNLSDDPGKRKVIVRRGKKHPENIIDFAKSSTSLMLACSGNGDLLPVYVVFKAEHLYESWTVGGPKSARYGNSKSGWFDQKHFEEWFERVAFPYLKDQPPPRALIGDNLASHFSCNVIKLCNDNDIRFVALPKNATHLTQPLDVAFFRPLKLEWRKILTTWRNKGNKGTLSKVCFPSFLKTLMENIKPNSSENIKSGFRKTGLIPLRREEVLSQLPNKGVDANAVDSSMEESFIGLLREMRYGKRTDTEKKKVRRSRITVEPGKSVGNLDSSSSETDTESSDPCDGQDRVSTASENDAPTTDNAANKFVTTPFDYEDIQEGQYLLINLTCSRKGRSTTGNQNHKFPAKVISVETTSSGVNTTVKVKFMKQYRIHKDTFVWPDVDDTSFVYPHEVVALLPEPQVIRYGQMRFPCEIV